MTPDFALSLSFEGIRLLHLTPQGWSPVGEVPLDSHDLSGDLAALRQAGLALGAPWRGTRVLLPNEQVRYLTLDDPQAGEAEVRAALDGATPYAVGDLVIAHMSKDGRTHVAAVARETLDEAEAFAAEHGFRPVSFGAEPPEGAYPGELSFGPTKLAATMPADEAATPAEAAPVPDEAQAVEPVRSEAAADEAAAAARPAEEEAAPQEGPAPEEVAASPEPDPVPVAATEEAPSTAAAPGPSAPLSATGVPQPIFASRARPLRGQKREDGVPSRAADKRARNEARIEPVLGQAPRGDAPASGWALSAPPASARKDPRVPPKTPPTQARKEPAISAPVEAAPGVKRVTAPQRETAELPRTSSEAARMTVFGARTGEAERVGGKPRYLGLILTVILVLVMLAVALLASRSEGGLAGLFRRAAPAATEVAAVPEPAAMAESAGPAAPDSVAAVEPSPSQVRPDADDAEAAALAVAAAIAELPQEPEDGDVPAPGATESPAEAERFYAATGVWLLAPSLPVQPQAEDVAGLAPASGDAVPSQSRPVLAAVSPDAPFAAPASPLPPGTSLPLDGRGLILATPEGTLTPEGILVIAGSPALVPPTRPGTPPGPADAQDAPGWVNAMAEPPGRTPPLRPAPPEEFLAALVPETAPPSGAEDPVLPGALAFAAVGLPAEAAPVAPGGVSLAGLRPNARPEDLAPEAEAPEAEPETLAAFDGPRPSSRPEGLAPEAPAGPDVTDAVAEALAAPPPPPETPAAPDLDATLAAIAASSPDPLAGATARAVAVASRPDARPRNFGRVVEDQLARLARASQAAPEAGQRARGDLQPNEAAESSQAEVASSAAAAPSGPTAASVAQAATFADAMALREINLIGVYGQPSARRALVRLGNGRYLRVGVGDSLDGGQVTAIGDYALNYVKRGRTEVLVIPGG